MLIQEARALSSRICSINLYNFCMLSSDITSSGKAASLSLVGAQHTFSLHFITLLVPSITVVVLLFPTDL